jgi:hypothetical protein
MTTAQIEELAQACGVPRRDRTDEQLFAACLRAIRAIMGSNP